MALNANTLRPALVDRTQGALAGPPAPGTPIVPGTDPSIRGRTGWSGDGAPGTLREFLTGAIMQHYPKTRARVAGRDFRLAMPGVAGYDSPQIPGALAVVATALNNSAAAL